MMTVATFLAGAFAVGADDAEDDFSKPSIGITVIDLDEAKDLFKNDKPPTRDGVVVANVLPYSPAAKAGIKRHDIVAVFDGKRIKSAKEFREVVDHLESKPTKVMWLPYLEWKPHKGTVLPVPKEAMFRNAMDRETDKVDGLVTYRHRDEPAHRVESAIQAYIVQKNGAMPTLHMRVQFVADAWLFVEKLEVLVDGNKFEVTPTKVERDSNVGVFREWFDSDGTANERKLLESITTGKDITVRYIGQENKRDRALSADEQARIETVLGAYRVMGGK
jgi:hypothetical protein